MDTMTFCEFVMTKDRSTEIDHSGWETCALGDYAEEVLGDRGKAVNDYCLGKISLLDGDTVLYECLNGSGHAVTFYPSGTLDASPENQVVLSTYGDLQDYFSGKLILLA